MIDFIHKIIKMPKTKKLGILAVVVLLLGAYYYTSFLSSTYTEIDDSQVEVDRLELEVSKKKGIAANLKRYRTEVKELDQELSKALRELPDKKDIDSLLAKISDKAKNSGLQVELFQPENEKYDDFYSEIPVKLKVNGEFHQVAVFFNEIGDLDRIVNLKEFTINKLNRNQSRNQSRKKTKNNSKTKNMLSTELTAVSFRFLDEKERRVREEKSKKKKK